MPNPIIQHLTKLRQGMSDASIDLYIQPSADPHLSEYVADRFKARQFLSGFKGSAGTLVVTAKKAALFTDGRYFIQAERELKGSSITLMKMDMAGYPTLEEWILEELNNEGSIGYDGRLIAASEESKLHRCLKSKNYSYITSQDLAESAWDSRPDYPLTKVFVHPLAYTGQTASDKISTLRHTLNKQNATAYIMSSLNDIAWLFNIRANDVAHTPVAYAYAIITATSAQLFIKKQQLDANVTEILYRNQVDILPYDNFYSYLSQLKDEAILLDPDKVNALMVSSTSTNNMHIHCSDPVFHMKARLSETEENNLRQAQIKDGAAMVKLLHWFDNNVASGELTEADVELKAAHFRSQQSLFIETSFKSIPAHGSNAAMMHYSTPENNSPKIPAKSLFLLDSGGQYMDGTTDITRTFTAGPLTEEEIRDFTLVLIAHIRLNRVHFLQGVTGTNLDIIARQIMWENHIDYKCGTGHSVGYLLGVHEGPARIKKEHTDVVLAPGMVLTNEPGIYKEGKHGIRTENTVIVKEAASNETGTYLNFDVISYCPIDTRCIDKSLMRNEEIEWLNTYHKEVFEKLSPLLDTDEVGWLQNATKAI